MIPPTKSFVTAAVLAALASANASAQLMSYSTRDVIIAFRSPSTADVAVNVGQVGDFIGQAAGTTVNLTPLLTVGGVNQLATTFGSPDLSSVSGLSYGAFASGGPSAGITGGVSYAANTVWVTKGRSNPDTQSTAYLDVSTTTAASYRSRTEGVIGQGATSGIIKYDGAINADLAEIPKANQNSYSTKRSAGNPNFAGTFPALEGTFGAFTLSKIDLYQIEGTAANPKLGSDYLGFFTVTSGGDLSFTAVPEPEEYALMFGGLLLLGAVARRRFSGEK